MLEVPGCGLGTWSWYGYGYWSLNIHDPNFVPLSRFWRCKEYQCPLSPDLELWLMLEVPGWSLVSWSWFAYGLYLHIEGAKKIYDFQMRIWIFRGCWSFLTGVSILILIFIWSMVFDTLIFKSLINIFQISNNNYFQYVTSKVY